MRNLGGIWKKVFFVWSMVWVVVLLYIVTVGQLDTYRVGLFGVIQFTLVLCFALFPARKKTPLQKRPSIFDILLMVATTACCTYGLLSVPRWLIPIFQNMTDVYFGIVMILLTMEGTRRTIGMIPVFITIGGFAYAWLGHLLPPPFYHTALPIADTIQYIFTRDNALYGLVTYVNGTVISIYIIFSSVLVVTGAGEVFVDIANLLAGRLRGGPALISTISSGFFGMISGSGAANVVTTGSFTIPTMKKLNYPASFAGAVEAVASSGGMIMPPIMGSAAFIMAEYLGVPYFSVCAAGLVPACLYFLSSLVSIYFFASKHDLKPEPTDSHTNVRNLLQWRKSGPVILPILALLFFLYRGFTAQMACFWALVLLIGLYLAGSGSLPEVKERSQKIVIGLANATRSLATLGALILCIQVFVSLVGYTQLGVIIGQTIMGLGQANIIIVIFLSIVTLFVLGCGLMASAVYIIGVSILAYPLIQLKMEPMAVHMFILYWATISAITPPVCSSIYIAATLAECKWTTCAFAATRLAASAYIVPIAFLIDPKLLLIGKPAEVAVALVFAAAATVFISGGVWGYFFTNTRIYERVLLVATGVCFFYPDYLINFVGFIPATVVLINQWLKRCSVKEREKVFVT